MRIFSKEYISQEDEKKLPDYKYAGGDASLLYRHFFSPIAEFIVQNLLPENIAPNLITLTGFFCTLIPHILIAIYNPKELAGHVPNWLCIMSSIGQFLYIILDNCDGKQARKTGNSSPLGLLFDHGCDAMNTFITGLSLFTVLQLGNGLTSIFAYAIIFTGFYMATWEEYFTGGLFLPIINGVNEGQLAVILIFAISGIFGNDIWLQEAMGWKINHIVVIFYSILWIPTLLTNVWKVYKHNPAKFQKSLKKLNMMWYLFFTGFMIYWFSITKIAQRFTRYFIYFIGFNFSKVVGIMQATHCADADFTQYNSSVLLTTTLLNIFMITGTVMERRVYSEGFIFTVLLIGTVVGYAHFVVKIIKQYTRVLNIQTFRVKKKNPEVNNGNNSAAAVAEKKDQ